MVHGGDFLFRSKVPAGLVEMALNPMQQVAASGIPVFLVTGNHERSVMPYPILWQFCVLPTLPMIEIEKKMFGSYLGEMGY